MDRELKNKLRVEQQADEEAALKAKKEKIAAEKAERELPVLCGSLTPGHNSSSSTYI